MPTRIGLAKGFACAWWLGVSSSPVQDRPESSPDPFALEIMGPGVKMQASHGWSSCQRGHVSFWRQLPEEQRRLSFLVQENFRLCLELMIKNLSLLLYLSLSITFY